MANTSTTVTTSATSIVAKNYSRIHLILKNDSGKTVFLGDSNSVTTSIGTPFYTGTERVFAYSGGDQNFYYRGAIFGIVSSGTAAVLAWEFVTAKG